MNDSSTAQHVILLVAHGSRREEANQDLVDLAGMLRPHVVPADVRCAYLELAEPSIPAGLDLAAREGAAQITLVPVFLSAGRHVQSDLQRIAAEFRVRRPNVELRVAEPIGLHPKLAEILIDRIHEARA